MKTEFINLNIGDVFISDGDTWEKSSESMAKNLDAEDHEAFFDAADEVDDAD